MRLFLFLTIVFFTFSTYSTERKEIIMLIDDPEISNTDVLLGPSSAQLSIASDTVRLLLQQLVNSSAGIGLNPRL